MSTWNRTDHGATIVSFFAREIDVLLRRLVVARHGGLPRMARLAARLVRARLWVQAGYARSEDFARERFGRSGRWLRDLAALGGSLDDWPELEHALTGADGGPPLGSVAARAIARYVEGRRRARVPPATTCEGTDECGKADAVAAWIAYARRHPVRVLRQALRETAAESGNGCFPSPCSEGGSTRLKVDGASGDTDEAERVVVRVAVPHEVGQAFAEVRELHEASSGGRVSGTTFVESLQAEIAASGVAVPDGETDASRAAARLQREVALDTARQRGPSSVPLHGGRFTETEGEAHAHADRVGGAVGETWDVPSRSPATRDALRILGALQAQRAGLEEWGTLDGDVHADDAAQVALLERFATCVELEEAVDRCLGALLAELEDLTPWSALGFADLGHYAETCLGMARSTARERATLARRLRRLPAIRAAYDRGQVRLEAAKLLTRAVQARKPAPDLERRWVTAAREITVKRLRDELRVVQRRRRPGKQEPSEPLDDATWFASLARAPGQALDRVLQAGFELVGRIQRGEPRGAPVETDVFLRLWLPEASAHDLAAGIESCRRALETRTVDERPEVGWSAAEQPEAEWRELPSMRLARAFSRRGLRVPAWVGLLAWLEEAVLVWDNPGAMPRRAAQRVYVRDGWRCTAPGCTSRQNLEDHHVTYRSRGGSDALDNRITLCRFHHQWGEHGGRMRVRGKAPLDLHWRLGRDALAVAYRNERRVVAT